MYMTGKNKLVLDFVLQAQREHPRGMPPSLRAIARGCGLGSAAAAQYHMKKLVDMGLAEGTEDKARMYRVIDVQEELITLQRAAQRYRPEQIFGREALDAWARRVGYDLYPRVVSQETGTSL